MSRIYFIFCFVILFIFISPLSAQSTFGGYSNKISWNQINTAYVRVIFPDSLEDKAQRIANIIAYLNEENKGLLGDKSRKVSIILRNRQVISNGYAQIAPLKSEFFMQSPQKTFEESALDWTDLLTLHEYRHVSQFSNSLRGIGKLIYFLFGDYGWGAMIGITAPAWFVEGDAVVTETALSNGGRGRVPSFSSKQRALLNEGVEYSFMKTLNGSYKDFVPNHYNIGYLINSEIRRTHGNDSWKEINRQASRLNGILYPFSRAVRKVTGKKVKAHLATANEKLAASIPKTEFPSVAITSPENKNIVIYNNPIIENDTVYYHFRSSREISGIYKQYGNKAKKLVAHQGIILDTYFDKHEHLFVWNELQRDIRRGNQNYSNLILYNAKTKTKELIGREQAFFSPSFSVDGKNLIFVANKPNMNSAIAVRNLESKEIQKIIESKTKQFLYPVSSEKGKYIYTIVKEGHNYAIAQVDYNGGLSLLTEWGTTVFGPLKVSKGHIIFQANFDELDNVYAYEIERKLIKRITSDPIGMYNPSNLQNNKIVVSKPHAGGFLLHEVETNPSEWKTLTQSRQARIPYYLETNHLETDNILEKISNEEFEISKYPRNLKLIQPHSWLASTDGTEISATIFSQNVLNNVSIQPTYRYNTNVNGSFLDLDIFYGRYFPVYGLSYTWTIPRVQESSDGERSFNVSQHSFRPTINFPLNLTKGIYNTVLNFNNSISITDTRIKEIGTSDEFNQSSLSLNTIFNYRSTRQRAIQNYYPKWGYNGTVYNRHRVNDSHNVFSISNDIYIPGFHKNHGFKFEVDYEQRNEPAEDRVELVDIFNYAHGFIRTDHDNILSFNTNYGLPLAYPDWGFWNFMYFKRINSVLFHNYNRINHEGQNTIFQSIGADLLFDTVFINNVFSEITFGFRNAYMIGPLPEGKKYPYHFEFILNIPAF